MRSKIRLGLLLAGLVLVWVSLPGTSVAAGSSCSNGGNWFAGYDTNYSNSRWARGQPSSTTTQISAATTHPVHPLAPLGS